MEIPEARSRNHPTNNEELTEATMAAYDALESFIASLTEADRTAITESVNMLRAELLAARSEEARVRLVHEFIRETHDAVGRREEGGEAARNLAAPYRSVLSSVSASRL